MAVAKIVSLIAYSRMNAHPISLTSAPAFLVYVRGRELNALFHLPKAVEARYLSALMDFAVLNARAVQTTSNQIRITS